MPAPDRRDSRGGEIPLTLPLSPSESVHSKDNRLPLAIAEKSGEPDPDSPCQVYRIHESDGEPTSDRSSSRSARRNQRGFQADGRRRGRTPGGSPVSRFIEFRITQTVNIEAMYEARVKLKRMSLVNTCM